MVRAAGPYAALLIHNDTNAMLSLEPGEPHERRVRLVHGSCGSAMTALLWCVAAAFCELAGCFTVWAWLRLHQTSLWLVPGALSLGAFAWLLTRLESPFAGRAYAAYGGVYIAASLVWLMVIEREMPSRWNLLGSALSVLGTLLILWKRF